MDFPEQSQWSGILSEMEVVSADDVSGDLHIFSSYNCFCYMLLFTTVNKIFYRLLVMGSCMPLTHFLHV